MNVDFFDKFIFFWKKINVDHGNISIVL